MMVRSVLVGLALLLSGQAFAQTSGVPPELLNNNRRQNGEAFTACFDTTATTIAFDHEVAQAIADALFVELKTKEGFGGFPLDGGGFIDELMIAMNNTCDVFMGISVQVNSPFPEWVSVSRPYATMPFVLAVDNPDWQKLGDIPRDRKLGTALQSLGELMYITWAQQQPEAQRWKRLPYANFDLMTKRVKDESLGGMLLWQPSLVKLMATNPDAASLRVIPLDPAPQAEIHVGALVSIKDSFLRTQIDEAIDALVADGTIAALMEKYNYIGHPGE